MPRTAAYPQRSVQYSAPIKLPSKHEPDNAFQIQCHDNLAIITLYLETPRSALELDRPKPDSEEKDKDTNQDETLSLLAPDFEAFYSKIPAFILPFTNLLSSSLHDARVIAATADTPTDPAPAPAPAPSRPNHNARARARDRRVRTSMAPVPLLSKQLGDRVRTLRRVQLSELPTARREMAATAAEVVAVRAKVLERTVVILERAKHGALARATRAKADHLTTVAQGIEGKLEYVCPLLLNCDMSFASLFCCRVGLLTGYVLQGYETRNCGYYLYTRDNRCAVEVQAASLADEGAFGGFAQGGD